MSALLTWPGLPLPVVLEIAILAALYGYVSRSVGKGVHLARGIGFPAVVAVSGLLCGLPGAILGLGWCFTRSAGLKPNDATPTKLKHFLSASVRLVPFVIGALIVTFAFHRPEALVAALVTGVAQLGWAAFYGEENAEALAEGRPIDPTANKLVEWGQAAAAGAVIALTMAF